MIMVCAVIQMPVMAIAALKMKYVRKIVMEIMHVVVLLVVVMLVGEQGISVVKCHVEGMLPIAMWPARPDILNGVLCDCTYPVSGSVSGSGLTS